MAQEQEVKYKSLGLCVGRNGEFKSAGVVIREMSDSVQVQPITSRGKLGRCLIDVPIDRNVFSQLAEVFTRLAANAAPVTAK
ncbi:hypothetical protein [Ralstonia pseudosolanacearum]|uniref:hypothetical protein n=1 Tax=Ralstonia pseudosolanacearum TaxID=1310165 RepID=UPI003CF0306C